METQTTTSISNYREALAYMQLTKTKSNFKVFVAGNTIELDVYGNLVGLPGKSCEYHRPSSKSALLVTDNSDDIVPKCECDDNGCATEPDFSYDPERGRIQRNSNTMKKIRRLVNHNFIPERSQFVTFTLKAQCSDFDSFKLMCQQLIRKIRRNVPGVKYIGFPGLTEKGGYHLHMLVDRELPITKEEAERYIIAGAIRSRKGAWLSMWPHGHVDVAAVDGGGNLGASIAQYYRKNVDELHMRNDHTFYRSDNLQPCMELRGDDGLQYIRSKIIKPDISPTYSYCCDGLKFINWKYHFEFLVRKRVVCS